MRFSLTSERSTEVGIASLLIAGLAGLLWILGAARPSVLASWWPVFAANSGATLLLLGRRLVLFSRRQNASWSRPDRALVSAIGVTYWLGLAAMFLTDVFSS